MKTYKNHCCISVKIRNAIGLMCCLMLSLLSCTEKIDDDNFAIKTQLTIADFIDENPDFSMMKTVFEKVKMRDVANASPIYSMLTARGNYTVFLPGNDAVLAFLKEHGVENIEELDAENLDLIAKSCIIDNGDKSAYSTADFPTEGSFEQANLNDRLLSSSMNELSEYIINGTSKVIVEDNELSNGYVHVVDVVLAPSALTLDKLIAEASNTKIFTMLLEKTSWCDSLHKNLDLSYEDLDRPEKFQLGGNPLTFFWARHRYLGYTALVETDSVYEKTLGMKIETDENGRLVNGEALLQSVETLAASCYGNAQAGNYTHPDNAVNQFVAYHLFDGKIAYQKFVHHYNEYGYKFGDAKEPQTANMPTNVWAYYTSKGKHRGLIQVTQVGDAGFENDMNHTMYVNRISEYANGPEEDYKEIGVVANYEGIRLHPYNGTDDNNALNGYYYPIDQLLFYTEGLRTQLANRRMRIDMTTFLPEMYSNNFIGGEYMRFENGYFDNIIHESGETVLLYLMQASAAGWNDYQGDELMVSGLYDITMKLPPVPRSGTYEVRLGAAHNPSRGMCQFYFGDDPDRLKPAGLPYDMRQIPEPENPNIPWIADTEDWSTNYEIDKNLRNQGYMKGPQYFTVCSGSAEMPVRKRGGIYGVVRRIVTVANMDADKDYYIRFKTALRKSDSRLFLDYIEYASTNVYNGVVAEDIW